jgi:phosphotransferase system HPr (HPr) family protein
MIELKLTVNNKLGLHARPATLLVQTAAKFLSDITVTKEDREVNAKSILAIMALGAMYGDDIILKIKGCDQEKASEELLELFSTNFGE